MILGKRLKKHMKKSKTADISDPLKVMEEVAKRLLGNDFIRVGIGGSFIETGQPTDYDTVLVVRKLNLPVIKKYYESINGIMGRKVSVNLFTELMWGHKMYGDKVATMLYKGMVFSDGYLFHMDFSELSEYVLDDATSEILQRHLKAVIAGKMTETRFVDLLVQYLVILCKNT